MGSSCSKNKVADIRTVKYKKSIYSEKCLICWDRLAKHVFYPCGHFGVCDKCYDILLPDDKMFCKCPMCNKNNSQLMKVYFCGNRVGSINPYMQIQKLNTQLKTEQQLNTIIKQKLEIIHELRARRV
ncbi:Zinc finger, C3HC4 type (RING finger) [seawater metagenome]|uniref:Zinc finger, C3HC4 type (RING finger) n=1 Tax=seawater metagenome TaxID=1561972 RepID=A0A5E8CM27_9ZZZZ